MIGFFSNTGDPSISNLTHRYLWNQEAWDNQVGEAARNYTSSEPKDWLELLLVAYYFEGKFSDLSWIGDTGYKVSNLSQKEKSIRVNVAVRRQNFHDRSDVERKQFLIDSTRRAVLLVAERMAKRKLAFHAERLLAGIDQAAKAYLQQK